MNAIDELQQQALSIFEDALAACDIDRAFERHLHFEGKTLVLDDDGEGNTRRIDLDDYKRLIVISFGKAGASMMASMFAVFAPARSPRRSNIAISNSLRAAIRCPIRIRLQQAVKPSTFFARSGKTASFCI